MVLAILNLNMKIETAIFGGGCFWCTEAVFSAGGGSAYGGKKFRGVKSVVPGYAGGRDLWHKPTYEEVSSGATGHAEVIKIEFDPKTISFRELLSVFFGTHDPTTLNRQGPDVGTQYRSIILYTSEDQKKEAEKYIKELNDSAGEGKSITTEVKPLEVFYDVEEYHKDYYAKNKDAAYCELVINPKLEKAQKEFASLLKKNEES